ncbi:MAG: hypothetical protein WKF58_00090 [Ilumatobacteraceae bacterium]
MDQLVEHVVLRPDRPRGPGQRLRGHPRRGHEPVRHAQPDARLVVLPRLHRGDRQYAGEQLRQQPPPGPFPGHENDPEIGQAQAERRYRSRPA